MLNVLRRKSVLITSICIAIVSQVMHVGMADADPPYPGELILTTQAWSPYITQENGRHGGLSSVALDCAFKKMGQNFRVDFLPWKRAQNEVRQGRAHGFFPASPNHERDSYATFSEPLIFNTWAWILLKDSPLDPESAAFKQQATVTSEAGSNLHFWLKDNGYKVGIAPDTHGQLGTMLLRKRIDAALVTVAVFDLQLEGLGVDAAQFRRHIIKEDPLGVYFSTSFLTEHPQLIASFNAAVKACR